MFLSFWVTKQSTEEKANTFWGRKVKLNEAQRTAVNESRPCLGLVPLNDVKHQTECGSRHNLKPSKGHHFSPGGLPFAHRQEHRKWDQGSGGALGTLSTEHLAGPCVGGEGTPELSRAWNECHQGRSARGWWAVICVLNSQGSRLTEAPCLGIQPDSFAAVQSLTRSTSSDQTAYRPPQYRFPLPQCSNSHLPLLVLHNKITLWEIKKGGFITQLVYANIDSARRAFCGGLICVHSPGTLISSWGCF